mmetsp:Transcript_40928/g.103097  ORF Transcript_40928/g.103097 Transcript_40928/m.103097 type:complete len:387 (+) Transcript_40928:216-1376(+)|eukprot:CAMPEP_0177648262 /NCGR_PEP_ID=MMETSP0447-20121125/10737_1 /TAXON_ID=0 /ORGANISM="Stygamoeba regulata, Strain BSH-02190019" /LENGTH=386 /DNA_ID=CAMNT_0019150897 /DNA_START=205 /DNA_END=1365 /DNA_ORIENTATION=+
MASLQQLFRSANLHVGVALCAGLVLGLVLATFAPALPAAFRLIDSADTVSLSACGECPVCPSASASASTGPVANLTHGVRMAGTLTTLADRGALQVEEDVTVVMLVVRPSDASDTNAKSDTNADEWSHLSQSDPRALAPVAPLSPPPQPRCHYLFAAAQNLMYTLLQRHSLRIYTRPLGVEPHWGKLVALRHALVAAPRSRYVAFLDSDAVFRHANASLAHPDGRTLAAVIDRHMESHHLMLITSHRRNSDSCGYGTPAYDYECQTHLGPDCRATWSCNPNTGVFVLRNVPATLQLLDTWLAARPPGNRFIMADGHNFLYDQAGFVHAVMPRYLPQIKIVDASVMNTRASDLVVHELGLAVARRNYRFRRYLNAFIDELECPEDPT